MSKLLSFKYLRGQRILTLALILTLASTLFSMTTLSLLGFYRCFNAYLGEGEDIVTIYDSNSRTPFTGLIPAYLAERIDSINGVLASSPEAIAPCLIRDKPIFLRGIIPENFNKLNQLTIIEGDMLKLDDMNSLIVGKNLAEELKLNLGDKVLIIGVLKNRYIELQVNGIYESHSPFDDEALAPLYVGQWLRSGDYSHVTLIRVKIDRSMVDPSIIFEEIAKEASNPSPSEGEEQQKPPTDSIIPRVRTHFKIEDIGVEEAQRFMKSYITNYGVTRETLLVLSIMIFFFSSASAAAASKTLISQHKGEIELLRSIGASKKTIKRDILIKLLPWSLLASAMGTLIATATLMMIQQNGYLQVLSHKLTFHLDPLVIVLNFILVSLLVSTSIIRSNLK